MARPAMLFVLGNASIDVTLNVPRLPAPGETLMARGIVRAPGGKGLNQAVVAARAGQAFGQQTFGQQTGRLAVRFCAPVGGEPEAAIIHTALGQEPFAERRLIQSEQPTDLSTLMVAEDGENCIVSTGDCADALTPYIAKSFARPMGAQDWLLVQGNLTEAATWAAVSLARNVVFNTAPIRWVSRRILAASTVVVANRGEAEAITGKADPAEAAAALGGTHGIVTLGAGGCILAHGGATRAFAAPAVTAVDTTGAGDAFCGMLAAALALGMPIEPAIGLAQHAAALSVTRPGCFGALPSATELHTILQGATP